MTGSNVMLSHKRLMTTRVDPGLRGWTVLTRCIIGWSEYRECENDLVNSDTTTDGAESRAMLVVLMALSN